MLALAGELHPQYHRPLAPHPEADRIERTPGRKMRARGIPSRITQVRIAQIAMQAQRFVVAARIRRFGSAMRSAAPGEAIAQRQPLAMRPELALVDFGRNEVRTSHFAHAPCQQFYSDRKPLLSHCSLWYVLFMAVERSEQLKSILAQEPNNTFARYALGMEYISAAQLELALQEFRTLLEVDANYANAFFMGAQALHRADRIEEAIAWLRDGIACAQRVGNRHAESEMQELLDELEA